MTSPKNKISKTGFPFKGFLNRLKVRPYYSTKNGVLFAEDCMRVLPLMKKNMVDTVFADPPFNLGKIYGRNTNDYRPEKEYVAWCKKWLWECVRILKPGGSIFIYNLPRWNLLLGSYLIEQGLELRHWIAIETNTTLPIPKRLYPSHYSLLYFTKGKPNTFRRIRTPLQVCRHCKKEVKDYGGHKKSLNPDGLTLKDVWTDIPPVRHWKFKSKKRKCNALSTKLLDRVVEISTAPGEVVLDPFGGSGTTFVVCQSKNRKWIGIEIDHAKEIIERLNSDSVKPHPNHDLIDIKDYQSKKIS